MSRGYRPWWAGARALPFWGKHTQKLAKRRQSKRRRAAGHAEIAGQMTTPLLPTGREDPLDCQHGCNGAPCDYEGCLLICHLATWECDLLKSRWEQY